MVKSNSVCAKNLKGIAIGNRSVDPNVQYKAYAQYAFMNRLVNQTTLTIANVMMKLVKGC